MQCTTKHAGLNGSNVLLQMDSRMNVYSDKPNCWYPFSTSIALLNSARGNVREKEKGSLWNEVLRLVSHDEPPNPFWHWHTPFTQLPWVLPPHSKLLLAATWQFEPTFHQKKSNFWKTRQIETDATHVQKHQSKEVSLSYWKRKMPVKYEVPFFIVSVQRRTISEAGVFNFHWKLKQFVQSSLAVNESRNIFMENLKKVKWNELVQKRYNCSQWFPWISSA